MVFYFSFKQQKFNLFREESEGYAKLVSELTPPYYGKTAELTTEVVQCLIGKSFLVCCKGWIYTLCRVC
jgi:hypothetical protein